MKRLELFSKYRTPLMGIAILMVVFFHFPVELPAPVSYVKKLCECGVDIFLLLSGFGLYESLRRSNDILSFYKRRIERLFPSYLPFIIVYFIFTVQKANEVNIFLHIKEFLGNIVMTGYFSGLDNQFNWYVQTIFWFYLITPVFFLMLSVDEKKKRGKNIAFLIVVLILINITALGSENLILPFSRVFVFLLGMIFADIRKRKDDIRYFSAVLIIFMFIGLAMWYVVGTRFYDYRRIFGLEWYPFLFIVPGLCVIFTKIFETVERGKAGREIISFVSVFGRASFEIYLVHCLINIILTYYYTSPYYIVLCVCMNIAAVIIGILFNKLINIIKKEKSKMKEN